MIVRRLPENSELYHHGIKGMRWYHRRFQNPDGSLTAAGRKRRGLVEQIKYNRRMKKVRKARVEKAKEKQRKAKELNAARQKAQAERKERAEIIKTGDAKQIQKIQSKMTPKEMEEALARVNFNKSLNDFAASQSKAKAEKNIARLNTVMNVATTVGSIAQSAANVHTSLTNMGIIKKKENKSQKDLLQDKKDILELQKSIKDLQKKPDKKDLLQDKKNILELQKSIKDLQKKPDKKFNKELEDLTKARLIAEEEGKTLKAVSEQVKANRIINGDDLTKPASLNIDDLRSMFNEELDKRFNN